jgi:beta-glucosidase
MKARLGLFDNPFLRIDGKREATSVLTKPALDLAREAARNSIVLLKNDGGLLPLPKAGQRIAIIGPFAEGPHHVNGNWVVYGDNGRAVDLATGIRAAVANPALVSVVQGSDVEKPVIGGIAAAVEAARAADVVILAIGEGERMSGEAQSRTEITIPDPQRQLVEAVAQTGKPMVVILKNGRALALDGPTAKASAILVTWFLGTQSGYAIADIVFGDHSPSGRLPCSFPRATGQEPYYYAHKSTGRPNGQGALEPYKTHFRGISNSALFPFGHGLTYSPIAYSELSLPTEMPWNGEIRISARLSNSGSREVQEVAQLYVHDRTASLTRPVRELKAFAKVAIEVGQTQIVEFRLKREQLQFLGRDNRSTVEPGLFDVWIAPSAEADGLHGTFVLTAPGQASDTGPAADTHMAERAAVER